MQCFQPTLASFCISVMASFSKCKRMHVLSGVSQTPNDFQLDSANSHQHEQMYWVQRHMAEQRANPRLSSLAMSHPRFGQPLPPKLVEKKDEGSMWNERRWQDFAEGKVKEVAALPRRNTIVDYSFRVYSNELISDDVEAGDEAPVLR
jgi:hypothetical protein